MTKDRFDLARVMAIAQDKLLEYEAEQSAIGAAILLILDELGYGQVLATAAARQAVQKYEEAMRQSFFKAQTMLERTAIVISMVSMAEQQIIQGITPENMEAAKRVVDDQENGV